MNGDNSSSSFELLNGSSSMSSGHSSPCVVAVIASHMDVDSAIWLYMRRCRKYSEPLERVYNDCRVTVQLDVSGQAEISDRLIMTGDDQGEVDKAVEEIERMVEHCQQSVSVKKLPRQSDAVYQKVVQHTNDVVTGAQISLGGPSAIRVIGTDDEVQDSMKRLGELCGVVEEEGEVVDGQVPGGENTGGDSRGTQIMKLEKDLWEYMQKNAEFSEDVRRLKEELHVDAVDTIDATEVELVYSGSGDDVTAAMDKTVLLISRCRATVNTKTVPCSDNRIFTKIVKFLPAVNKTPAYVSAANDVVRITGNEKERADCCEKLAKLGLVVEDQSTPHNTGVVTTVDVSQPPPPSVAVPAAEGRDAAKTDAPTDPMGRMEIPRPFDRSENRPPLPGFASQVHHDAAMAVQRQRPDNPASMAAGGDIWRGEELQRSSDDGGGGGQMSTEFPVPIEAMLWVFIEKRRRQELQELRDSFGVGVQSYQSDDDGMVRLRLDATSADMLGLGQDALGQLIDQLSKTVSVTALETNAGEELPRELAQIFHQLSEDTDGIIEMAGPRIIIFGTSEGTAECQQKIAAFFQQMQQMHENPEMMAEMQQCIMQAAGRTGVDGDTMLRNMQNQLMTGVSGARGGRGGGGPMGMMGALPGMTRGPPGSMSRFGAPGLRGGGAGRGGGGMGGLGGMMGLPPGMLGGGPGGGPPGIPGGGPIGMDGRMMPPPMDSRPRNMMGGGGTRAPDDVMRPPMSGGGTRAPDDVMRPPMGGGGTRAPDDVMRPPMSLPTVPSTTDSATDLLSGQPGGMVGNLATTPGSVILGLPQPASKSDDQPTAAPPQPGSGPPPPTTKKADPLPPPRMLDDAEERALLQGRGLLPPPAPSTDHNASTSGRPDRVAAAEPEPTCTETKSRGRDHVGDEDPAVATPGGGGEMCTACEAAGGKAFRAGGDGRKCQHAFCVSCVRSYFSQGETECPVCGVKDELSGGRTTTQPAGGHMLTTYENGFKLPGFETTSRGTIVVTYSFPSGIQTDDMPFPGRKYAGTTKSAFFPMSTDGLRLVDLLQQAFNARLLFTLQTPSDGSADQLVWNGVCHKTNVFGGPQQSGYPDPVYMRRVRSELASKGLK